MRIESEQALAFRGNLNAEPTCLYYHYRSYELTADPLEVFRPSTLQPRKPLP